MNDEVLMGVMHRRTHDLKQLQPGRDVQTVRVAVGVDGDAVDVFHDDVGGAVRQRAAIQQMRDVRVIELSQDLALDLEPGLHGVGDRAAEDHLDGHSLVEFGVRALGEENLPHAAHPQGAQHTIRPDAVAFHG